MAARQPDRTVEALSPASTATMTGFAIRHRGRSSSSSAGEGHRRGARRVTDVARSGDTIPPCPLRLLLTTMDGGANHDEGADDDVVVGPRPKILLVDDDQAVLRVLASGLGRDYELSFASDAVTAVSVARRERPDLIVLDYRLPGGDGALVIDRLRTFGDLAYIPIVLMSGWESPWSWEQLLELELAFIPKPFELDALKAEIERMLPAKVSA
jgi:CheY-like chemotaxis protein